MKEYFAENIRKLRRDADITQEKLSELIGVSPQTVSKWERAETYPDIETLPVLSNFFGVTIDSLLGNDRLHAEAEMERLMEEINKTVLLGDDKRAFELAKEAYRRYPYSYKMMDFYCDMLGLCCPDKDTWERECAPEIRRVSQLIIDGCTDETLRLSAYYNLFNATDDENELLRICEKFPSGITSIREKRLEDIHKITTDEGRRLRQKNMLDFLWWFRNEVHELCGRWWGGHPELPRCDVDTWIDVCKMGIAVFKCLFRDGDYNEFAWNIAADYYHLAEAYLERGDSERALAALEEMAEFSAMDMACPSYAEHTSYLVDRIVYDGEKLPPQGTCGSSGDYLQLLNAPRFDPVRHDPRFAMVKQKLSDAEAL